MSNYVLLKLFLIIS